jgi:DNA recombination protein RmuC
MTAVISLPIIVFVLLMTNGLTTLAVFLSSLQMGFRTLAIEKSSSEVWQLLSAVKTALSNFSELLDKAQKNIQPGLNQLEDVVGARIPIAIGTIQKRLKGVETISNAEVQQILPELTNGKLNDEE